MGKQDAVLHFRPVMEMDLFGFYNRLSDIVTRETRGHGHPNGTEWPFSHEDVCAALRLHQIREEDLDGAIQHAIEMRWLERRDQYYHVIQNSLSMYHCLLRRV